MTLRLSIQIDSSHHNFSRNWHTQRQVRRWHLSSISSCSLDRGKTDFFWFKNVLVSKNDVWMLRMFHDMMNMMSQFFAGFSLWTTVLARNWVKDAVFVTRRFTEVAKLRGFYNATDVSDSLPTRDPTHPHGSLVRPWGQAKDIQQKNTVVTYVQDISMGHRAAKIAFKSWFLVMRMTMEFKKCFRAWRDSIIWISFQRSFPL